MNTNQKFAIAIAIVAIAAFVFYAIAARRSAPIEPAINAQAQENDGVTDVGTSPTNLRIEDPLGKNLGVRDRG